MLVKEGRSKLPATCHSMGYNL